jgi:VCBS repeat-containing protein
MKHHHKPTYSGNLSAVMLSTDATVTGRAIVKVLNGPRDSHWHVENPSRVAVYPSLYGSLTIDYDGYWTYTLDHEITAVENLATGDTLTDSIEIKSVYHYRNMPWPRVSIVIAGA